MYVVLYMCVCVRYATYPSAGVSVLNNACVGVCVCVRGRWVFVGVSGCVTFSWPHFLFLATLRGHPRGARQLCGALTLRAMLLNHFINIHTYTDTQRV